MTPRNRIRLSKLSLGLLLALAAAPSFAQNTTAAVGGRISDASGHAIAGADVTILHTESGSVSHVTTDADGRYVARGLRVGGPYTITIVKDGKSQTREGVYLALAQTTEVDASINDATTLAAVEVTGSRISPLFSPTAMGAGTSISREQLTSFASIQRNLQDYARLDPRFSQTDKERGEISAGGQNSRYNTITIDSMATNDTFGLEANNLPTLKQPVSIDAIQSVQVNISNYDVTQKGYTGANINAVTKSGTNDFHGSLYYVYRDESVAGDRFDRTNDTYFDPPKFSEDTKGMTLGGPLIKDRLFFFTSYEELNSTRDGAAFGPLGSNLPNTSITPSAIAGAQAIATGTYGFDAGNASAGGGELNVKDALFKLDANITDRQRASLRWSRTQQSEPIFPNFFNNLISLDSDWYTQDKEIETYIGQVFSDWTDNFSTEFKASYRDYASKPINASNLPQVRLNFSGALPAGSPNVPTSAGLIFGTERSRHFNDLATKTRNYYFAGNWFLGAHELKFGTDYDDNTVFNAFLQDTKGNYTFGCINGAAGFYSNPLISGAVTCSSATRAQIEAATLENFQRGRPTSYQVQIAAPGHTINDGVAQWSYQNLGLFLQDTWSVNDKLTLDLGFRFDQIQMNDKPLFNAAASAAPIASAVSNFVSPQSFTIVKRATGGFGRRNDVTLDGQTLISPRLGFNYTFASERPTQLRGGVGLFEGSAANVWLSNPYSNTGIATRIIGCGISGFSACPTSGGLFSSDPDNQPSSFAGSSPAANVDFLSHNLRQPSVYKANLAFEHELPFHGIVFSAEYIHTSVRDGVYFKHLNLGDPTFQGVDGRDMFWTKQGYNTACWNQSTGASITSGATCSGFRSRALSNASFANVVLAQHTGKGGGDNLSLSLSGKFGTDWDWSFGYSYTSATEVSNLSSSVSNSNWQSLSVFNANEEKAENSAYLVKDRFTGQLNWKHKFFGDYATRIALFYEGRAGKPYSWIYNNDLNGDGSTNDLLYIPEQGSGNVIFHDSTGAVSPAAEAKFWHFVRANDLQRYEGGYVPRNSSFAPWVNTFDLRISQEMTGFFNDNKLMLTMDVLNVGNLINKKWGHTDEIAFQSQGGFARSFVNYLGVDANGNYIYGVNSSVEDFITRQVKGESQWAAQFTIKYEF